MYDFNKETNTIIKYVGNEKHVKIPSEIDGVAVKTIGNSAFKNNQDIESVMIPDGIEIIKEEAFYGCSSLESVEMADSVKNIESGIFGHCHKLQFVGISENISKVPPLMFASCHSLTHLYIPDNVEEIGLGAFIHCNKLSSISMGDDLGIIRSMAFRGCNLSQLFIPQGVSKIEDNAFEGNPIEKIKVSGHNLHFSSEDGVLFNKEKTSLLLFPLKREGEYEVPKSVEEIQRTAFKNCSLSIISTNNVKHIQDYAFENSMELEYADVRNVERLGAGVFINNEKLSMVLLENLKEADIYSFAQTGLKEVTIPRGLETIEDYLFYKSVNLKEINLHKGVKEIKNGAFYGCPVEKVSIPKNVVKIDPQAFFNEQFMDYIVDERNPYLSSEDGVLFNKDKTILIHCPMGKKDSYAAPNGVEVVGEKAFMATSLENVTLPKTTKIVEKSAFEFGVSLKSIDMASVEEVEVGAFSGCYNLIKANMSKELLKDADIIFPDCERLSHIESIKSSLKKLASPPQSMPIRQGI